MTDSPHKPFRFGVVGTPHGGGAAWLTLARRVADAGFTSLLTPDGMQLPAPFAALAVAAGATQLRVGTFVAAAPLRPSALAAREAHSLGVLTDGRFDFGIGTGRPAVEEWTRQLGLPWGTPAQRLTQVGDTIDRLRALDGPDRHTPVLVAAGGPRARELAAAKADIVTIAAGALVSRSEIAAQVAEVRAHAGERADQIEFAMNIFVVGEHMPQHVQRYVGTDLATLIERDSPALLRGGPAEMVDELHRRRAELGISYFAVNAEYLDAFAPAAARASGS